MRKLFALPLVLSVSVPLAGIAQAAPGPQCAHWFVKKDKDGAVVENGQYAWTDGAPAEKALKNCFADEIFVLDGDQQITITIPGKPAVPGNPTAVPPIPAVPEVPAMMKLVDLVNCKPTPGADMMVGTPDDGIDAKDCALGDFAGQFNGGGIEGVASKVVEQIKTLLPTAQYDEIVLFSADFGPATQPGPLFFRVKNSMGQFINEVANIAPATVLPRADRDPAKPYVGLINGGNVKALGATPWTGAYGPCGKTPRRPIDDPVPGDQPAGALCAPGLYTYFDALAQATANIYGPYLAADPAVHGGTFSVLPAIKGALVATGQMGVVTSKWPDGGLAANVWNAFLSTEGSILGGNTWRDSGNATYSVTRPPAYQGVSAPFENAQVLRFTAMDLYVMGFIGSSEVPAVQSLMNATPGMVFQPAVSTFGPAVGPYMGSRVAGVSVRSLPTGLRPIPKTIPFQEIATFNGGERAPNSEMAPQHIRQLWVLVTKPKKVVDASIAAAAAADKEKQTLTELREQVAQVELLQRFRQEYNRYFYTLTGYRGRVLTHSEGSVDDMGYWEFGDARDDRKEFQAGGGLDFVIPGPEDIVNSGGRKMSVLRVNKTTGNGSISFNPQGRTVKISGKMKTASANNLLTVRMRLPREPALQGRLKGKISFQGAQGNADIEFPSDENAHLLADGVWHNYSVDLSKTAFVDKEFNKFVFYPATGDYGDVNEISNIEIEFIRVSWTAAANLKDSDKACNKTDDQPDGWLDLEDNCKNLYNPDQADGNGDGLGDACEDYDGDNVVNSCDNCATVTNSSQRDGNGNGLGDACDGDKPGDCFFQTSTVGGPVSPTSAVVWASGLILGVILTTAVRRRRRRR